MSEPKLARPELLAQELPAEDKERPIIASRGITPAQWKAAFNDAMAKNNLAIRRQGQTAALQFLLILLNTAHLHRLITMEDVEAAIARVEAGGSLEEGE